MRSSVKPLVLVTAAALSPLACGDDEPSGPGDPGAAASLSISADTVRLAAIGAAYPLDATVADASGVALGDVSVNWSSVDEGVATVDGSGRVEAVAAGETEVTAEAGDASDAATVIVTQTAASVAVSPGYGELTAIGDSVRLEAVVRDANGSAVEGAAVEWASGDTTVATVDGEGRVSAESNGTAVVTATAGDIADEATVVVEQAVAAVTVTPAADTIGQGRTTPLEATVADANGEEVAGASVVWTTSDPEVATVDASGRVTGTGWGANAEIAATVDGVSGTANVRLLDQIAFSRDDDGDAQIIAVNADGSDPTNISRNLEYEFDPDWSPDGSTLAFVRADGTDDDIYVMDADGSSPIPLTDDPATDRYPAWSPDGDAILFESDRDGYDEVYIMDADGTDPTNVTDNGTDDRLPDWSPDGSQIVFTSARDSIVDAEGDTIANFEIYVMNADGSDQTNLTDHASTDHDAAWSPDGSKIAFVSGRDGDSDIYVMDVDGSNPVNLTQSAAADFYPDWSPDGSRITFSRRENGTYDIYVMDADGSNQTRLTDGPALDIRPTWRPRP